MILFKRLFKPVFISSLILLTSCNIDRTVGEGDTVVEVDAQQVQKQLKYTPGDPFAETIIESEYFEVTGLKEHVIETEDGAVIYIPKGAFLDGDGNLVEKEVKLEIAKSASLEELLASGISSSTEKGVLEADQVLYVNATADGKMLSINPESPLYIEQPVDTDSKGNLVFKGVRGEDGLIHWIAPEEAKKYLTPVPIASLDFLPAGFEGKLLENMPFRGRETISQEFVHDLFYEFTKRRIGTYDELLETNEPSVLQHAELPPNCEYILLNHYADYGVCFVADLGIDPAQIKVLKSGKFENTFVATTAFQERLQVLYKVGSGDELIELYLKNLDKDLWEVDQQVLSLLTKVGSEESIEKVSRDLAKNFDVYMDYDVIIDFDPRPLNEAAKSDSVDVMASRLFVEQPIAEKIIAQYEQFVAEKLTNVKELKPSAVALGKYYEKELKKVQRALNVAQEKLVKQRAKKDAKGEQLEKEYIGLLKKREQYRMKKFGFELKELGWTAVGSELTTGDLATFELSVKVTDGASYDRTHVYIITPRIKSLFSMRSADGEVFDQAGAYDPHLIMNSKEEAVAVAVAFKDGSAFFGTIPFEQKETLHLEIKLSALTSGELKTQLASLQKHYKQENSIEKDLAYQAKLYREQLRQQSLTHERIVMSSLLLAAYPSIEEVWPRLEGGADHGVDEHH